MFIFGNGFVGISDVSLTGTHTDITSCTQVLAPCRNVEGNKVHSLETEALICGMIGEDCIDCIGRYTLEASDSSSEDKNTWSKHYKINKS